MRLIDADALIEFIDKSEDAKPKENDNIIYRDFMKKGRE